MSWGVRDAPGAFGFLIGVASSVGLSLAGEVALGLADSSGAADALVPGSGVGELLFFFFFGEPDGELCAVGVSDASGFGVTDGADFDELLLLCAGVGDSSGGGELFRFGDGVGVGDFSGFGVAEGDADALGLGDADGVGELADFLPVELLRFFGGGVGSKIFLILSPNESSAARAAGMLKPKRIASRSKRVPHRQHVIPSQRRRRGTSHWVLGSLLMMR